MSKPKSKKQEVQGAPAIDWVAIEALEKAAHKPVIESVPEEEAIQFDEWWLMREQAINKPKHYKDIVRVDARARGLGKKELVSKWDWAARQFGLIW
jgi:hypothetical protein